MKKLLNGIVIAGIALMLSGGLQAPEKPSVLPKLPKTANAVSSASYDVPKPSTSSVGSGGSSSAPIARGAETPVSTGSHEDWMAQAGIAAGDYAAVDYIVSHESGWRYWVVNSEGSGATGLCQALPGYKMASAGADWATNPITQLRWCASYASSRYGGWWASYDHWLSHGNW